MTAPVLNSTAANCDPPFGKEAAGSNPVSPTSISAGQRPAPEMVKASVAASTATNPNFDILIEGSSPAYAALPYGLVANVLICPDGAAEVLLAGGIQAVLLP